MHLCLVNKPIITSNNMRNLLIPTDFTVHSLDLVSRAASALDQQPTNIFLFHAFTINITAPDVLGNPRRLPYAELLTDEFRSACRRISQKYPFVRDLSVKHMYGSNVRVFRNFIDANDIDMIICPEDFVFHKVSPRSVNPEKMFRKSGVPVLNPVLRKTTFINSSSQPLAETLALLIK